MRRLAPLLLLLIAAGCLFGPSAQTDRARYSIGDDGVATFRNDGRAVAFLEGCSTFVLEQLVRGTWTFRRPAVVCVWEGLARPVLPGASLAEPFHLAGEPGTWRLSYHVGIGCEPDRPLSDASCRSMMDVQTPPFTVQEPCDLLECGPQLGMPNQLCPDGVNFSGPTGRCLRDPTFDVCGWEVARCPDGAAR